MNICDATNLGSYDRCEDVEIGIFESEIVIKNVVNKWECSFNDGLTIGKLTPGSYITEYNDITYTFVVV
jgi:hypothetical protein